MKLYTIGYAGKSAREFFTILKNSDVKKIIDVRLYPSTKDCGFARSKDLEFFLWVLCRIKYEHHKEFSPTPAMLKGYKDDLFGWNDIEEQYLNVCKARKFTLTPDMDCACFFMCRTDCRTMPPQVISGISRQSKPGCENYTFITPSFALTYDFM